jgi:hypothetical protein
VPYDEVFYGEPAQRAQPRRLKVVR